MNGEVDPSFVRAFTSFLTENSEGIRRVQESRQRKKKLKLPVKDASLNLPPWDDRTRDPNEFRLTAEDAARKRETRMSKNADFCRVTLQDKQNQRQLSPSMEKIIHEKFVENRKKNNISTEELVGKLLLRSEILLEESRQLRMGLTAVNWQEAQITSTSYE